MKHIIDTNRWPRRAQYEFFSEFEEPFFGLSADVECGAAYSLCKAKGYSFYLYYLHKILLAANQIEEFRYRIEDQQVVLWDSIRIGGTVDRADGTFGFAHYSFAQDFEQFAQLAKAEMARVRGRSDLEHSDGQDDIIHFSAIPWVSFTSLSHARHFKRADSCPKISTGKLREVMTGKGLATVMPVSVHGHHALMDGMHVGRFFELLEALLGSESQP
ncbi:CatA-like O-acetyltransferase [Aliidiomarina maris]|uniref:Chloramphenicol O-acetyltransferase type A n=1 Tax=Aliidiomarina maris TaxID=531312 RepID=A0A327WYD1_9GAMM|nr:CatA-like O-acetyltransferase [Aliidiomarina maris]RAJ98327.1 chloramphenicol O-acetyltransferase type A [Aliidiomarina maris]RUO24848.1 chloramphenicol acetyltransferase [Aliidiomarina maris]